MDIPRRSAQVELSLTVVSEMGGELQAAARGYAVLTGDERLSGRDRARSRLWIGTALSTAKAHILLSDTGTRAQGLALLDETARLALDSGLSHQLRSIESIRTDALAEAR